MNDDQKLVAMMVVILIALVGWTTYRPWLSAVLFTPPQPGPGTSLWDRAIPGSGLFDPWGIGNALGNAAGGSRGNKWWTYLLDNNPTSGPASAGTPTAPAPSSAGGYI